MSGQSLMTEVGWILSIGDDLAGMDLMSLRTSSAEGGMMTERGSESDICVLSANREFGWLWANFMVRLVFWDWQSCSGRKWQSCYRCAGYNQLMMSMRCVWPALNPLSIHVTLTAMRLSQGRTQGRPKCASPPISRYYSLQLEIFIPLNSMLLHRVQ